MSRVFAYCRVSTAEQTTSNQAQEISAAGFAVTRARNAAETISGSTAASRRAGFGKLMEELEAGDLVVTKLDRLGRDAMDVRSTVEALDGMGVRVHCLALGGVDLTSAAGRMTMQVIAAVAEFERDLLIERTQSGLARAKAQGKALGRPRALTQAPGTRGAPASCSGRSRSSGGTRAEDLARDDHAHQGCGRSLIGPAARRRPAPSHSALDGTADQTVHRWRPCRACRAAPTRPRHPASGISTSANSASASSGQLQRATVRKRRYA